MAKRKKFTLLIIILAVLAALAWFLLGSSAEDDYANDEGEPIAEVQQAEKKRGGLIYSPSNSYRVIAPEGWMIDTEIGQKFGYPAVFYPVGSNWDEAESRVYTKSLNKAGHPYEQLVNDSIKWYREKFPKMQISEWDSITTADGRKAIVKMLDGDPARDLEMVAYVDEPKTVTLIVLLAKNEQAFADGYPAYEEIVKSYTFVTDEVEIKTKEEVEKEAAQ